jgi:hypothetical protein
VHMHEGELHPSGIEQAKLGQSASTTPRTYLVCIVAVVRTRYGEGHGHLVPTVPHTRVPPQQHVIRILWPLHSMAQAGEGSTSGMHVWPLLKRYGQDAGSQAAGTQHTHTQWTSRAALW